MINYIKCLPYDGRPLRGEWDITYKLDGVRAFITPQGVFSRAGKPLYNLDSFIKPGQIQDVEVFTGSWSDTITKVRSQTPQKIYPAQLFGLSGGEYDLGVDFRLYCSLVRDPTHAEIYQHLEDAIMKGYEGIVIRQSDVWYKLKPQETYDVEVLGMTLGTGKHYGKLGAVITKHGNVGVGFTDAERLERWTGRTIEVKARGLTAENKFIHPVFLRRRDDK